jgi:hypothetical protein
LVCQAYNCQTLIKRCFEIYSHPVNDRDGYQISEGLTQLFILLSEFNSKLYIRVVQHYLSIEQQLDIPYSIIVQCLLRIATPDAAYKILVQASVKNKKTRRKMIFAYYECLDLSQIKQTDISKLISLYNKADYDDPPHHTDYLLKYQHVDNEFIPRIAKIVLEKIKTDEKYARTISMLFNPFSEAGKSLSTIFVQNKELLKKLYFTLEDNKMTSDINDKIIKTIYNLDSSFLFEYFDRMYGQNNYITSYQDNIEYEFLWLYDDYRVRIKKILKYLQRKEMKKGFFISLYVNKIFKVMKGSKEGGAIIERQNNYIEDEIIKHNNNSKLMTFLFSIILSMDDERRKKFVFCFIDHNKDYGQFKKLPMEPYVWTFIGGHAPVVRGRIEYFQSLLPYFNTVDLLEHKLYIENRIKELRREMEYWKKKDFLDD